MSQVGFARAEGLPETMPVVRVGADVSDEVRPDRVEFVVRFEGRKPTKEDCRAAYLEDVGRLRDALAPLGLADEVTTSGYGCHATYCRRKGPGGSYDYCARGSLRLPLEGSDVEGVWDALVAAGVRGGMRAHFYLEDEDAAKGALLARAVATARRNAEALAEAAGMALAGVARISHGACDEGWERYGWSVCADASARGSVDGCGGVPSLEPEPVEVSCHVDVEWLLEERRP